MNRPREAITVQNPQTPGLIRQHERYRCEHEAFAAVASAHAEQVSLSPVVSETRGGLSGAMGVTIIDYSAGGVGLRTQVFIPKRALLTLVLPGGAGSSASRGELRAVLRVQRVMMLDRSPSYYLGTSLDETPEGQRLGLRLIARLMELSGDPASAESRTSGRGVARD
jgi:hypothetical protein